MRKNHTPGLRLLALALTMMMCLAMLVCALHTGHDCSSDPNCLICQLIDHRETLAALMAASLGILPAIRAFCLASEHAARLISYFTPLVCLHVQLND